MRTRYELTIAGLGFLAALAAFGGCKTPATSVPGDGEGGNQDVGMGADGQRPPACNLVCATAQDCGIAGGLQDASHFECVTNRCQWTGCKSKADCTAAFQADNFICAKEGGAPVPQCIRTCSAAADCAGQGGADDASHYACTSGRCQWLGCKSNAECSSAFQSDKFICVKDPGAPVPECVLNCNAPADCVPPGGNGPDASRFTCTSHRCAYKGCASTEECKSMYGLDKLVCE